MKGIAFFILLMASSGALLSAVNNLTREKIEINNIKIHLPYISFGNVNSIDLLGLDELIILKFYYIKKNIH